MIYRFLLTLMLLFSPITAIAEEREGNPAQEMTKIMQCISSNIVLSHLHLQVAASLKVLSAPNGINILPMVKGYEELAKMEKSRIEDYTKIAEEIFIPQLLTAGMTREKINETSARLLATIVGDIMKNVTNPKFQLDEKMAMEKILMDKVAECETHFSKVERSNTY